MKKEVVEKLAALITTAFGLVAALAWNDAIKSLFNEEGPLHSLSVYGPWFYALFVTLIAVFAAIYIGRIQAQANKEFEKREVKRLKQAQINSKKK